jgi:hypothetical protein
MRWGVPAVLTCLLAWACEKPPVEWSDTSYSTIPAGTEKPALREFGDPRACSATLRMSGTGRDSVAVWWSVRNDSSAVLMFTRWQPNNWITPIAIDTTDASRRGCARPAPAIALGSEGNVHVTYFLEPATGPGVFFAHSMDSMGFHDPVSIAYGKRPSETDVASAGDRVVVAYEEPNSERGQIWLALSQTMGHIFESRLPVSSGNEIAGSPAVKLDGTKLEIEWKELVQADSLGRSRRASRTGTWN